ncbi:uncharacterized protein B0P05DRAFT_556519 [Gilbertella persicaria]|uniref:uncharacterized protein n=1 Tax=Gilbertella persicaria TaxID=101096 RepID=UPI002220B3F8|nr:uncharacterized protein B0P05DRAFT_556519 [Gilbertella persicaria]KAI8062314.1 hypothetical protein B0P05DRAFT_556519 [Gilbertella persicaria]
MLLLLNCYPALFLFRSSQYTCMAFIYNHVLTLFFRVQPCLNQVIEIVSSQHSHQRFMVKIPGVLCFHMTR